MKRQLLCTVMLASLILSACSQPSAPVQESTEIQATAQEESSEALSETLAEAETDSAGKADAAESNRSSASSIESVRFDSSVTGTEQRMQVYKPAGYNENQKYPVLYLINGGFTDDTAWLGMGLQETADQMMEDGSMPKMLIVMPDGSLHEPQDQIDADQQTNRREGSSHEGDQGKERQSGDSGQKGWSGEMPDDEVEEIDPVKQAEANETRAKFVTELTDYIIPYVEAHYSVYTDRDNRAVAGFSYGGAEALYAGVGRFDQFSSIGVFSMGIMGGSNAGPRAIQGSGSSLTPEEFVKEYPDFFSDAETTNENLSLFWIGVGKDDNIIAGGAKLLSDTLDEYGIDHEFHETEGGHTPDNWLTYFREFSAKLFPAERIYQNVLKMDTHLHVDVPMEDEDIPWQETPDLGKAMENAGMNAIGMAFAVDYVELKGDGHAYKRFMNALDEMDRILEANGIQRTLNYDQMMEHFEKDEPVVIQSVEGGHFLEGDVSRIQEAYDRGLRVFCLLHDNDADPPLGDVYTNEPQYGGLTELGAATIEECERLGILVDLAHCDDTTVAMALEKATKPLMISHTGLKGAVDENDFMAKMMQQRLISPETAKLVADHDGVIGIWPHLANTPEQYAANIKAMVEVVGVDHVTIGTDSKITTEFNEWEDMPHDDNEGKDPGFGDGEMPELPEGMGGFGQKNEDAVNHVWNAEEDNFYHSVIRCLVKEGFNEEEIGKLTGGNFARIFREATSKKI